MHYHEFARELHTRLHAMHEALPKMVVKSRSGLPVFRHAQPSEHPLDTLAAELAARCRVLCLDELHVTTVGDAMVLPRCVRPGTGFAMLAACNGRASSVYDACAHHPAARRLLPEG